VPELKLVLTTHAEERCRERAIGMDVLQALLVAPTASGPAKGRSPNTRWASGAGPVGNKRSWVTMIYRVEGQSAWVITAYIGPATFRQTEREIRSAGEAQT